MRDLSDKSRKLARERYWSEHDKSDYTCPDCGRSESEIVGTFQVHHKTGTPFDNREDALVGLCGLCHRLREGKKPSFGRIKTLRDALTDDIEYRFSEVTLSFVDEYVCLCAGGWGQPWSDSWKTWTDFFEQHAQRHGAAADFDLQSELGDVLEEMPHCQLTQHSHGFSVTGPAPNQCDKDCFTRSDITADELPEVVRYE